MSHSIHRSAVQQFKSAAAFQCDPVDSPGGLDANSQDYIALQAFFDRKTWVNWFGVPGDGLRLMI